MRIFNENKTIEIQNPDLEKGYLVDEKIKIGETDEIAEVKEQGHYEIGTEYPNDGKEYWVVDVPYVAFQKSEPIFEDIQLYIPYSDEELRAKEAQRIELERVANQEKHIKLIQEFYRQHETEIAELNNSQDYLDATDYKAIQFAEGIIDASDFEPIKQQRIEARNNVRRLKEIIKNAKVEKGIKNY